MKTRPLKLVLARTYGRAEAWSRWKLVRERQPNYQFKLHFQDSEKGSNSETGRLRHSRERLVGHHWRVEATD